jgi:hypothetical protein
VHVPPEPYARRDMLDELELWRRLAPLLPFAVHYDHRRARALSRIPTQRRPVKLPPREVPPGMPAKPNTVWGTRSDR